MSIFKGRSNAPSRARVEPNPFYMVGSPSRSESAVLLELESDSE